MLIYNILYLLAIMFCFLETNIRRIKIGGVCLKTADISFWILNIYILLLGVMRSETLGVDSFSYKNYYWERYKNYQFWDLIKLNDDWGYSLINWLISKFISEFWMFQGILFCVTYMLIAVWIRKHSKNVAMSFFIYYALGFLSFDFSILRQALAVGIFVWSYDFLVKRRPVKYILVILLAATCHKSALFMLVMYPLLSPKDSSGKQMIRYGYIMGAIGLSLTVEKWVSLVYSRHNYQNNLGKGGFRLLLYFAVLFGLLYFLIRRYHCNKEVKAEYQLAISTVYFQIIATSVSIATRVLKYTTVYLLVLIPRIIEGQSKKTRNWITLLLVCYLSIIYVKEFSGSEIVPYVTWLESK